MNVEHRLQHAARDLREVEIVAPPLGAPARRRSPRRLQALAAPMLFVAGGLLAISGVRGTTPEPTIRDSDIVLPASEPTDTGQPVDAIEPVEPGDQVEPAPSPADPTPVAAVPSVHDELEMIGEVATGRHVATGSPDVDATSDSDGDRRNRTSIIGPI